VQGEFLLSGKFVQTEVSEQLVTIFNLRFLFIRGDCGLMLQLLAVGSFGV
jgi:hypothetical protein